MYSVCKQTEADEYITDERRPKRKKEGKLGRIEQVTCTWCMLQEAEVGERDEQRPGTDPL
jgi:hypothetical protein